MIRSNIFGLLARTGLAATFVLAGFAPGAANAGLVSYDVQVTGFMTPDNGTNVERYAATNIDPEAGSNDTSGAPLPNTISPTPNPSPFTSTTSRVNRSATPLSFDSTSELNREFWLKGPLSDAAEIFVNNLDQSKLVEVELKLRFDNLPLGEKIVLSDVKLIDAGNDAFAESVEVLSGVGSVASPLHLLMKFTAADVETSGTQMKIQFDYDTMVVPEPASLALAGLLVIGICGVCRSRVGG